MTAVIDNVSHATGAQRASPESAFERARRKGDAGGGLYKPRTPIYPKLVHVRWRRIKWALLIATLAVYYVTPWVRWPRPSGLPQQAVLVDFDGGRFYFFGLQLWPQEVYFITGLLVMAALALFLSNALFGRLWCGYACPQTVWTDLYIYVERAFEGDRNARLRLDAAPWTFDKAWRRTVQAGLMPVTAGLVMAGAIVLAQATAINWKTAAVTAVATVLFLASRLHPLLVLAAAAALGACGLLG